MHPVIPSGLPVVAAVYALAAARVRGDAAGYAVLRDDDCVAGDDLLLGAVVVLREVLRRVVEDASLCDVLSDAGPFADIPSRLRSHVLVLDAGEAVDRQALCSAGHPEDLDSLIDAVARAWVLAAGAARVGEFARIMCLSASMLEAGI